MARTLYNVIERPRKTSLVAWIQNPPLSLYCFVLRSANTLRHRSLGLNLACDKSRAGKVAAVHWRDGYWIVQFVQKGPNSSVFLLLLDSSPFFSLFNETV